MKYFISLIFIMCLASSVSAEQSGTNISQRYPDLVLSDRQIATDSQKALSGDGNAATELGMYYLMVARDRAEGEYWYRIAAENGDPGGQQYYGTLLLKAPNQNRAHAIFWLKRAASSGDPIATRMLEGLSH